MLNHYSLLFLNEQVREILYCLMPSLVLFCFFFPLLENDFILLYYLLDPFRALVILIRENGYCVGGSLDSLPFLFCEKRRGIHFVILFSPVGFTIEMNDGYDDDYCDQDDRRQPESNTPVPQSDVSVFFQVFLDTIGVCVLHCNRGTLQGFVNLVFDNGLDSPNNLIRKIFDDRVHLRRRTGSSGNLLQFRVGYFCLRALFEGVCK